jgi:hypothetical protein
MRADIPGKGLIEFEGRILPEGAKYFEFASFYGSLSADTRKWILDLRYAWARARSAPSDLVLRACGEIEDRIHSERSALFDHLQRRFPDVRPEEFWTEWLDAIATMRNCAEHCVKCEWTIQPQPGEVPHFLKVIQRIASTMIHTHREKYSAERLLPLRRVLEVIESCPESEQIRFINDVVDSLSDEEGRS